MLICIEKMTRDAHAVLCIQDISSLLGSNVQARLHIFLPLAEDDILAMALTSQQVDSVSSVPGICSFQPLMHTPPQVDTSKYKSRGVKAAGKRRWRACTSLVCSRFLHVSFAKKSPAQFFSRQFDFACKNGTTYFCPANVHKNRRDQRTPYDHVALTTWDWPISGGDQERNGDRKSEKKKPGKKKPDTSKRENDKGLKKIKPPKRDGLAALLQKKASGSSSSYLATSYSWCSCCLPSTQLLMGSSKHIVSTEIKSKRCLVPLETYL